ncbi:MAG: hypothetical protein JJT96_05810 [Opitutales bacterium]|nr:hypothetical protein [Opitutales bacterium]
MSQKTYLALLFSLFSIFLFGCQAAAQSPSPTPAPASRAEPGISIVSWNIEWYPGMRRFARGEEMRAHAERVKPVLAEINPDIFLAQEMRDWQSFAELTDVVPGLRPAVVSMFVSPQDGSYWRQQVAIGSKLYTKAAWAEEWRAGEDIHPRRGFTAALIRIPNTFRFLLVYSVHLKSNLSRSEEERQRNYDTRDESIRQLLAHIRHMQDTVFPDRIAGVVVGGDFNTNQDGQFGDNVVSMMVEAGFFHTWSDVPREERLTWRGSDRFQPTTFDHFFTKGVGEPRAEMLEVPDDTSDHWPVRIFIPFSALRE